MKSTKEEAVRAKTELWDTLRLKRTESVKDSKGRMDAGKLQGIGRHLKTGAELCTRGEKPGATSQRWANVSSGV